MELEKHFFPRWVARDVKRCPECCLKNELCLCNEIPRVDTKTRMVMVFHALEVNASTNTGRFAARALENCESHLRGAYRVACDLSHLKDPSEYETYVLFPTVEQNTITAQWVQQLKKPLRLVVPEGTWSQASKMVRHDDVLRALPRVQLPAGIKSQYQLRYREEGVTGLATLESIAKALEVIEGVDVAQPLKALFETMVRRSLVMRGKLDYFSEHSREDCR